MPIATTLKCLQSTVELCSNPSLDRRAISPATRYESISYEERAQPFPVVLRLDARSAMEVVPV